MLLVVPCVWRVVGCYCINGPVAERLPYGLDVLVRPQRRIHLVCRVIAEYLSRRQHEVVRRHLGRDIDATLFGPPKHIHRLGTGNMADVQSGSSELGNLHISRNHACLGCCRPSLEPELARDLTLVAAGTFPGEMGVLCMLGNDPIKSSDIFQRSTHETCVPDAMTVVGEHPYAGAGPSHQPKLGQLDSVQSFTHRAHWHHLDMTVAGAQRCDMLGGLRRVSDGSRIGHRQHGGVTAPRRGGRAGLDGLGILTSRLSEVRVQIDQARQRDQPIRIELLHIASGVGRVDEAAIPDEQVRPPAADEISAADEQVCHSSPPSSSYSTLIRTDTPAATWSKINELAASAASAEISNPRFIGPGWQMAASGFIAFSLGRVRP